AVHFEPAAAAAFAASAASLIAVSVSVTVALNVAVPEGAWARTRTGAHNAITITRATAPDAPSVRLNIKRPPISCNSPSDRFGRITSGVFAAVESMLAEL